MLIAPRDGSPSYWRPAGFSDRRFQTAVASRVKELAAQPPNGRPIIAVERLAALYPVAGPRDVMQHLWDSGDGVVGAPVIVLIPGVLRERKVYSFVNSRDELMYRGDIL